VFVSDCPLVSFGVSCFCEASTEGRKRGRKEGGMEGRKEGGREEGGKEGKREGRKERGKEGRKEGRREREGKKERRKEGETYTSILVFASSRLAAGVRTSKTDWRRLSAILSSCQGDS
jgi:hypothetical protein